MNRTDPKANFVFDIWNSLKWNKIFPNVYIFYVSKILIIMIIMIKYNKNTMHK